jgi:hypothetical protein
VPIPGSALFALYTMLDVIWRLNTSCGTRTRSEDVPPPLFHTPIASTFVPLCKSGFPTVVMSWYGRYSGVRPFDDSWFPAFVFHAGVPAGISGERYTSTPLIQATNPSS